MNGKVFCGIIFYIFISFFCYSQKFTIAVIPDSQNYTDYRYQTISNPSFPIDFINVYQHQIEYISKNAISNGGDIVFAIHLGDNVLHHGEQELEWELASNTISLLDNVIPYGMVPGNHDYDERTQREDKTWAFNGTTHFINYFGEKSIHFNNKEWYGGSFHEGLSSWIKFSACGIEFLFIGLELEAGDAVLDWAQSVIEQNKNLPTIVATHEYLHWGYDYYNPGEHRLCTNQYRRDSGDYNSASQIWEKFISKNKQIFIVLCGHAYNKEQGEAARTDINNDGYKVYQLLSDYEGRNELFKFLQVSNSPYGGDGWFRLLHFDLNKQQIHIQTYSTELKRYEKDYDSDFIIQFDWNWEERFKE